MSLYISRLFVLLAVAAFMLMACQPIQPLPVTAETAAAPLTDLEAKVQNALSAAPPVIAAGATVVDWPAAAGGEQAILRQGSSEWVCMPDWPATPDNDPMCLDETWSAWMSAFMMGAEPEVATLGIAYMLAGGAAASNSDPFAMQPAQGEDWVVPPPHVMLLQPGGFDAAVFGTDHTTGMPWIMWDDTPYEFLIIPTVAAAERTGPIAATDSTETKIENIMGATTQVVADGATMLDWPTEPGGEQALLRKGTNEWVCVPDWPATPDNDPMCFDPTWTAWMGAFMSGAQPEVEVLGISYMLAGGAAASNTDPSAMQPAEGEDWVVPPPHVMLIAPGGFDSELFSTDHTWGGPWIMWDDTPYEFLIVPIE